MPRRLLASLAVLLALATLARADAPATAPATAPAEPGPVVCLFGMGDWGTGSPAQKRVADAMAERVRLSAPEAFSAVLLAGDNFYGRLTGPADPRWRNDFEFVYDERVMAFPFYATAGNHDYEGGKLRAEMEYARRHPDSRWKYPARWYRVDLPTRQRPLVTILMLDSNRDAIAPADWAAQAKWIDDQLANVERDRRADPSAKRWTIAVAHHPLYSNGQHGDIGPLQAAWGPIFDRRGLDVYLAGHDHDLQHLEVPGHPKTSFVLCGGGGAGGRPMRRDDRGPFSKRAHGFTQFRFTPDKATVTIVGANGQVLHAFDKAAADGAVKVTFTTPSDKASPFQLKSYLGLGEDDADDGLEEATPPASPARR